MSDHVFKKAGSVCRNVSGVSHTEKTRKILKQKANIQGFIATRKESALLNSRGGQYHRNGGVSLLRNGGVSIHRNIQPNVVLESYAYKKPVIATDIGSLKELIVNERTGFLFNKKDHLDLRNKIETFFNNNLFVQKLGKNSYDLMLEKYSPEIHVYKLIKLFETLIQDKQNKF